MAKFYMGPRGAKDMRTIGKGKQMLASSWEVDSGLAGVSGRRSRMDGGPTV